VGGVPTLLHTKAISLVVDRTTITGNRGGNLGVRNFTDLDSLGGNCVRGGLLAMDVLRYAASAQHTWWGSPSGSLLGRTVSIGGSIDARYPLPSAPDYCATAGR